MENANKPSSSRGEAPSVVEKFEIVRLYDTRTLCFTSSHAATILIAPNGAGKSTLLAAMNAFLTGQFNRLLSIPFKEIVCKLSGHDEMVLKYSDIVEALKPENNQDILTFSRHIDVEYPRFLNFLLSEYDEAKYRALVFQRSPMNHDIYTSIRRNTTVPLSGTIELLNNYREMFFQNQSQLSEIFKTLRKAFEDIEIVYLPTYRRIELPMVDTQDEYSARQKNIGLSSNSSLFGGSINFGLSDISARLKALNQQLLESSNTGYKQISAKIIDDLVEQSYAVQETHDSSIPSEQHLNMFFKRLKDVETRPHSKLDFSIPAVEKIYQIINGTDQEFGTRKFLRYFVSKLGTVISATQTIENMVEQFVTVCNKYLSFEDAGTAKPYGSSLSTKKLNLNRQNLRVSVEANSGKPVSLDSLSSGEKQMVSLFATLFLYDKKKVVLIDEPELSLSLEWQRDILVDILNSPLCLQIVAITHSPFVFDNELQPFAKALNVTLEEMPPGPLKNSGSEELDIDSL